MTIREKINQQLIAALKSKNKALVSTLRLVMAAIKERDIANRREGKREDIKDQEILRVLVKMKKQRQDSADLYKKGGRQELLQIEIDEIKVIDSYLPKQLTEEELKKICIKTIESLGATSIKDMGKIMGALKKKNAESIDFSKVNLIIKDLLK